MLRFSRFRTLGLITLVCVLTVHCSSGSGNGITDPGTGNGEFSATFTGSDPNPGAFTFSMASDTSADENFEIEILVTDIAEFFGAAFHVTFDSSTATFTGFTSDGSFIIERGVTTDISAETAAGDPGELLVTATRQGQVAGVDATGSQLLITLMFEATQEITSPAGNVFGFDIAATREVKTCPAPPDECTTVMDGDITWSGGTLMAN